LLLTLIDIFKETTAMCLGGDGGGPNVNGVSAPKQTSKEDLNPATGVETAAACGRGDEKPHWLLYEIVGNLPLLIMLLVGTLTVYSACPDSFWSWIRAAFYLGYAAVGVTWFTVSACPRRSAKAAASPGAKKGNRFSRGRFWAGVCAIVPLWIVPPLAAGTALYFDFSWLVTILALAFAIDAFIVLPLVARLYVCARCDQKTSCPWMGSGMKCEAG